jgi:hypothetical protein
VVNESKGTQGEARLEKAAREENRSGVPQYETAAQAVREKMARLKALRLARDASQPRPAATTKTAATAGRSGKKASSSKSGKSKSNVPLSDWLDEQKGSGRRS